MRISLERSTRACGAPPVYSQIADQIRDEIEARAPDGRRRLPPIRELARELGVNRDTVALAYERLARGGPRRVARSGAAPSWHAAPARRAPSRAASSRPSRRWRSGCSSSNARARASAARRDAVPMHTLVPDPRSIPVDDLPRTLNRALAGRRRGAAALRRARRATRGLREVAGRASARGRHATSSPTRSSCATARARASRWRCGSSPTPGDAVAVEEPTYHNVLGAILGPGPRPGARADARATAPISTRSSGCSRGRR